jgi:peroxin-5
MASWEAQFSQFANGSAGLDDAEAEEAYREMMADQAEEIARGEAEGAAEALQGSIDERGWPRLGPYAFGRSLHDPTPSTSQPDRLDADMGPFLCVESTNPYAQSGRTAASDPPSSLSDRALFLEAALQEQQRAASSSTATVQARLAEAGSWLDLGETQTQDEKELAGMRALEAARQAFEGVLSLGPELTAVDRAEAERGLGRTLISLAVSYTNEAYDEAAYQTLHRHLELLHPAESRPLPAAPAGGAVANPWEMHAVLTEAYLDVVRAEMARGTVVPESQMALGLLNYSQGEFDRSADCWGAALTIRPDVRATHSFARAPSPRQRDPTG